MSFEIFDSYSRWEDDKDFLKNLDRVDLSSISNGEAGGVPLHSNGRVAYIDDFDNHSLIIGSTGSKKTRLIVMPTLQILARAGESMVITDPKGELYNRTYDILKKNDYEVFTINLREPSTGNCWNPLCFPYTLFKTNDFIKIDKARELLDDLAQSIIPVKFSKDPYWESSAQDFF